MSQAGVCLRLPQVALMALLLSSPALAQDKEAVRAERQPKVQIALLLDNSGSMSGLINQARTQMWRVVNEFAKARQNGKPLRLELALYEYGESVKRLSPLTTNLDAVSEQLFGLGIRGGDEHCGQVIATAVSELEWSGNADDLKLIYIAGNEPFTQGPVHFSKAIESAKRKGISVNVVHCGGDDGSWRDGALAAGTPFMMINQNAQVAQVVAPQDAQLAQLNGQLNQTYVGYGARGKASVARQQSMDKAAASAAPAALAERAASKGSSHYRNAEWDLVDGMKDGAVKLDKLDDEALPEEMRELKKEERAAYVEKKAQEREAIQKQITEVSAARKKYLADQQKAAPAGEVTLDQAMSDSVRREGGAKGISF